MRDRLTFYEYDGFEDEAGQICDLLDATGLSLSEIHHLDWISKCHSKSGPVFDISQKNIRAQQFIGTICVGKKELQVLPKLLKSKQEEGRNAQILQNLFLMLEYVNQVEGLDADSRNLGFGSGSFIEVYIRIFSVRLNRLLRRFPPKGYVARRDNLHTLRGKLHFADHIRLNVANGSRVFCEYDEFTLDNPFNQLFKFVSDQLLKITSMSDSRKSLLRARDQLSDVADVVVSYESVKNLVVPDRARELKVVLALAKMFLRYLRSDLYGGHNSSVAVLIDMNELYENFCFNVLNRNKEALGIRSVEFQKGRRLVSGVRQLGDQEFQPKSMFSTFQDIVVEFESGKRLVIDTKYKLLDVTGKAHFGIANADVYQILAYRELNAGIDPTAVALIYPEHRERIRTEFKVNSPNDVRFIVTTVDLGLDLLQGVGPFVEEFREIFQKLGLTA
jgi:5-methylcytosine-specific restriction enzyme subunit McrC